MVPKNYQHITALAFATKEINENHQILSNFTMGFHIFDNYFNAKWSYHAAIQILSSLENFVPNFKCGTQNNLMAVIGGLDPDVSLYVATVLDIYKIPQVRHISFCLCVKHLCNTGPRQKVSGPIYAEISNYVLFNQ